MTKVYTTNTQIEFYAKVIPFGLYYMYRQLKKKKSQCELKLKIEKFENIPIHTEKKEKKKKNRYTLVQRNKKEEGKYKEKKEDFEVCDIEVNHK